jgi:hypothetical protein
VSVPDVDLVRARGRELRARGQQRGQVKHQVHFELGQDALEQTGIEDRPQELALDEARQRGVERREIDRDDRPAGAREARDQAVANLTASARDEDDRLAHPSILHQSWRSATGTG